MTNVTEASLLKQAYEVSGANYDAIVDGVVALTKKVGADSEVLPEALEQAQAAADANFALTLRVGALAVMLSRIGN